MSTQIQDPDWTLGWRLRRSLEYGDIDIAEMAEAIDVHRTTISRWLHDEVIPRRLFLREWADRTGVRLEWLTGEDPKVPGEGPRSSVGAGRGALTDNKKYVEKRGRRPARNPTKSHSYRYCRRLNTYSKGSVRPLALMVAPVLSSHRLWNGSHRRESGGR